MTLTNTAELNSGQFSIVKVVDGSGTSLVPASTEFTVNYSYPAGTGFEAGEGTLTVRADGVVVTSDPLPYGAEVTLEEATPPTIDGGTWGTPMFSETVVTIGDETVVELTLTNTNTATPPTPTLPQTGTPVPLPVVGAGLVALLLGAALIAARKRA